jgi:hypothetical protein
MLSSLRSEQVEVVERWEGMVGVDLWTPSWHVADMYPTSLLAMESG